MKYEYSALRAKYGKFMVPAYEVKVDGMDIAKSAGCIVQDLSVSLSISDPGTVSFQICGCYDSESRSIESCVKNSLKLGAKVEVSLGYGSDLTGVFVGYIDEVGIKMTAEEAMVCSVTAADPVKLMKEGGKRCRELHVSSCAEAFETVMEPYLGLCRLESDPDGGGEDMTLFQNCSDYDFINNKLIRTLNPGYEFFLSAGVAYYREKNSSSEVVLELKPGAGLQSFQWSLSYLNRKITVLGLGAGDVLLMAEKEAASADLSASAVQEAGVIIVPEADTQDKVDDLAEKSINRLTGKKKNGSASVIGLPELLPGKNIKIGDIDSRIDGIYAILTVKHTIGENGFQTELTIGG